MIITRTPFRISFFGGGTDYPAGYRGHSGSVLATTINQYCYISCRHALWQGFDTSITFLEAGLRTWSYRLKTANLAKGFLRNLRRFLGRFPGFLSPQHSARALGLYLLGAEYA